VTRGPAPRRGLAALLAVLALLCALAPAEATPVAASAPAGASRELSPVDLIDLEVTYDTLLTQYYKNVAAQRIIDGAHVGIVAYLRERGIANPSVPALKASGKYAIDLHAPGREVGAAVQRYGNKIDPHELVYHAIAGEVAALNDPYTTFFTADQEKAFSKFLNPEAFGGIGIVMHVDAQSGKVLVDEAIEGGPAQKAGIQNGDALVAIDGVATAGQTAAALQQHLRGKTGSVVMISYVRGANQTPTAVRLVRAQVTPPDALGRMLPANVGYIVLRSYGANAAKELDAALRDLDRRGARAYVLDLRDNGGGYRDAAVSITSRFVPAGPVMIVAERSGKRSTIPTNGAAPERKPLAVLVNGNTASAAEITAGAVQDTQTGRLVGTRTFGKGLVQRMYPLPDGAALKVTIERYYTAHGRDIDRKGIAPDVNLEQPQGSVSGDPARDPQLARALQELGTVP
jgi:carboxyl-terminal processing protease